MSQPTPLHPAGLEALVEQLGSDASDVRRAHRMMILALSCEAVRAHFAQNPEIEHFLLQPASVRTALILHLLHCEACHRAHADAVVFEHTREPELPDLDEEQQRRLSQSLKNLPRKTSINDSLREPLAQAAYDGHKDD